MVYIGVLTVLDFLHVRTHGQNLDDAREDPKPLPADPREGSGPRQQLPCPSAETGPVARYIGDGTAGLGREGRMGSMRALKSWKGIALVTAGVLAGFLLGLPIAQAATTLVQIQSCCASFTAQVNREHRLYVTTGAASSSVFAVTEPSGETTVLSATGNAAKSTGSTNSDIVGISVDVSSAGTSPVTVAVRKGNQQGLGQIIWQGTLPANQVGHIDATFGKQSILFLPGTNSGFNVNVTNTGSAAVQYEVYGFGFGVACCQPFKAQWAKAGK